ncbi:kinase-like protein [Linderina pennispora]|uniref:non-specific serine/threonine protein kinase n=1 Tax=Linderina pennispora TaxID=61395 RepID=A0A1Y1WMI4_9FUNG|nr:kinase-like protein [Linderina pennispora]ORX74426.1 kinase-like protein [Linderina pennispora]
MCTKGMNCRQWKHLLDEASFSLSLQHPNVIRTYQFVREADGTVYSIMEYCEKDLFTVVQEGSLTAEDIDRLYFQLLSGIAYLHDVAHVAHRDMKLDNLCVDEDGNLKIIDFGCSSTFDPLAPAQTRGVDVWATAVIYLAMVSGHFPWEVAKSEDPNYALYLKYHGRVIDHWLPKDKAANPLIKQMLMIDPAMRPTVDELMHDPWVASLEERFGHAKSRTSSTVSKTTLIGLAQTTKQQELTGIYTHPNSSTSTVSSGLSLSSGY